MTRHSLHFAVIADKLELYSTKRRIEKEKCKVYCVLNNSVYVMGLQDTKGSWQLSATAVAQCSEFDRAQHNKLPITEDPSLMFSILKVACD